MIQNQSHPSLPCIIQVFLHTVVSFPSMLGPRLTIVQAAYPGMDVKIIDHQERAKAAKKRNRK